MILTLGTTPTIQRSMTFRRLEIDEVNRAIAVREYASGKSINAARVLHTLGLKVGALSIVGGDRGVQMRRDLALSNINHAFTDSSAQTRLCITLIDESNNTASELVEEAAPIERAAFEQLLSTLESLLPRATFLLLCGTLAPGAGDDFYARCIRLANARNVPTLLDTRGEPLKLALAEHPTIVKPNRSELAQTVGRPIESTEDLQNAIREIIAMGAKSVAVTAGAKPTIASDGQLFWEIAAPKINVVSPIGSGDSFAAGLAAGLSRGDSLPAACVFATACASANAMTSDAGFLRAQDVETISAQVQARLLS